MIHKNPTTWILHKLKTDQRETQNILGNIFSQRMSDKGLVTKIYKELLTVKEESGNKVKRAGLPAHPSRLHGQLSSSSVRLCLPLVLPPSNSDMRCRLSLE